MMRKGIGVINGGSSSIKFSLFSYGNGTDLQLLFKGQVDGIGMAPRFVAKTPEGTLLDQREWADHQDVDRRTLLDFLIRWVSNHAEHVNIQAVGHRVVHGGDAFSQPVRIDQAIVEQLETLIPLAPLHQPHNLAPIRTIAKLNPQLLQVACFDTAFHATNPPVARNFALPRALTAAGVHRYGFHGLSYEYIARRLPEIDPQSARGRVIVAHLGNGASMCALHHGRSIASTMGFTAMDGLPMGTRTGSLDPGVVLYLLRQREMDLDAVERLLYNESGLLGISQISNDMRVLIESDDIRAKEAIDLFVYRIRREVGALAAALEGLDALVFTAGIGEHAAPIRAAVCQGLQWLGVHLDPEANHKDGPRIDAPHSDVAVWVVPTNEELMIATHTRNLMK